MAAARKRKTGSRRGRARPTKARRKARARAPAGGDVSRKLLGRLVALARKEVGTREVGGNNRGARIEEYQQATWLPPGPWPWCAAFTAWLMREWLNDAEVRRALGLANEADVGRWRCRDSRAFGWRDWASARGARRLPEGHLARAGDFVVYDFSHIGLVCEDQPDLTTPLRTIEGNTNGAGTRESETGDGVWPKTREPGLVDTLIRLF
jgi:hypothetical protein